MTKTEVERAAQLMRRARLGRYTVKTEPQLRAWAEKFMRDDLPEPAAEEIGAMYHALVQRVYGAGGG